MIKFTAKGRCARCDTFDRLTTGSVGLPVEFCFDAAWDGLAKVAVFIGSGAAVDVALTGSSCTVPPEVLSEAGDLLTIGVYGTGESGAVVIPTVYATAGRILRGAEPSGVEPTPQTQPLIDQLLEAAEDARDIAQSVRDDANNGVFNGADGNAIWRTSAAPSSVTVMGVTRLYYNLSDLSGASGRSQQQGDIIVKNGDYLYYAQGVIGDRCEVVAIGSIKGDAGPQGPQGETGPQGATGPQGLQGAPGADGYSPSASVSKSGNTATITVTDKNGTTTATVTDGAKGETGDSGVAIGPNEPTDTNVNVWVDTSGGADEGGAVTSVNGETGDVVLDASDVGAIAAPASPTSGQYLAWNGSAWVAQSLPVYSGGVS